MAKNTIADLDTTASNNTDVLGQSTQGTAAVSTLDTIIQNALGLLARFYVDLGGEGTVGGSANAITYTSASTYQALEDGLVVSLKAGSSNTSTTTLNVDSLGAKEVRLSGDTALSGSEILSGGIYMFRYESSYNSSAGAWVLLNPSISAATTSLAGKVKLATPAAALTGTATDTAVTPAGLYFPTGHLYGLTLSQAADTANDVTIAAGTARDASDSANMVLAAAITKQGDASWAVGTNQGGMDTGSIADGTNYIWLIKRSDTGVVDALISASSSAPTMPTNYDIKRLIGYFVRASSTNGLPVMTDRQPGTELTGTAPVFACRAWVNFNGTGTVAIRGSGNVSSITDNGTGDYTVNFATAMPDAKYAAVANAFASNGSLICFARTSNSMQAASCQIEVYPSGSGGGGNADASTISAAFFR